MPATSVTEFLFEAKPRWSGTIGSGGVAAANTTTIPLSSAANLDNGDAYIFVVNRVTSAGVKNELSEMETGIGELSGTNFVNCVRGQEGTAQAWEAGTVVEILFTASHWNKLIEWAESEHKQDGSHSDITADSVISSGAIEGASLELASGATVTSVKDEDDMASNSATALATQQSIKAYIDSGTVTMTNKTLTSPTINNGTFTGGGALSSRIVGFTRNVSAANGDVSITGVGFTPTAIMFLGAIGNSSAVSHGFVDSSKAMGYVAMYQADTYAINSIACISIAPNASNYANAVLKSFDADGFTLTWTKTGSPTGTASIYALCFR